jgi:carbamoyl-phosphate synthase large subunit
LYATTGTHKFLVDHGIDVNIATWPDEEGGPNVLEILGGNQFDLVINIPKNFRKEELTYGYQIRRKAVDHAIPLITNIQLAKRFIEAVYWKPLDELKIKAWDEYQS